VTATTRVLITNDDGIDSPGLLTLAKCAVSLGWETIVAAPATESSGTSAGLVAATDERQMVVERRTLPGLSDVDTYAVAAHPGLIALVACHDGFGPRPDLILSGVNRGANVGRAVLHSGTVGAALTAGINDTRAVAVSLDVGVANGTRPVEAHWDSAAAVLSEILPAVAGMDPATVVNVNVPNISVDQVRPLRWARLATFGRAQSRVDQVRAGVIQIATVVVDGELEPGTDAALLAEGHATITPLRSISERTDLMNGDLAQPPS
jgi:5'-nucleotidase